MRTIVAELLYNESGESIRDLQRYVPDIHLKNQYDEAISSNFRVFKSHYHNNPSCPNIGKYKKVIYIVRDPRDVVLSHYKYIRRFKKSVLEFDDFLSHWLNGRIWPCSWAEHVNSWTQSDSKELDIKLIVVKYEELLNNPYSQLVRIVNFLGIETFNRDINQILRKTSLESMRLRERNGMPEHEQSDSGGFIGVGSSKQWAQKLSSEQLKSISDYLGKGMANHGYD